jgi:hypothetical protein
MGWRRRMRAPRHKVGTHWAQTCCKDAPQVTERLDECYLIPVREVIGCKAMSLRLTPTGNNQAEGVHWARDYELRTSLMRNWGVEL